MNMGIRARLRDRRAGKRERGAALAEFALMLPFLVLLLVGMIELGWGLAQQIDVRHKAREALRQVIVDASETEIEYELLALQINLVAYSCWPTVGPDIVLLVPVRTRSF